MAIPEKSFQNDRIGAALKWCHDKALGLPQRQIRFPAAESIPEPPKRSYVGFVYLLRAGDHYKIGVAKDVETRVDALQPGCPFKIEVHHVWRSYDPFKVERRMHFRLREYRRHGEWFALPDSVVGDLLLIRNIHQW